MDEDQMWIIALVAIAMLLPLFVFALYKLATCNSGSR